MATNSVEPVSSMEPGSSMEYGSILVGKAYHFWVHQVKGELHTINVLALYGKKAYSSSNNLSFSKRYHVNENLFRACDTTLYKKDIFSYR